METLDRYRTDGLSSRISGMAGTPAEDAFVAWMTAQGRVQGRDYLRTGYDRTNTDTAFLATLPIVERYRPDFIGMGGHWYEIQGCGQEQVVRFKREKLEVQWAHYANRGEGTRQVRFFIYDMAHHRAYVMPMQTVLWAIHHTDSRYDEQLLDGRKAGWEVPLTLFTARLIVDAPGYAKQLARKAQVELEKADEQAARDTVRKLRAAGVNAGSADGDAA